MSRQKKPKKVSTITHRNGTVVDLMLDPNNLTFNATIMEGVSFGGKTAQEVRIAVEKYLNENSRFEWIPVIEIEEKSPFASRDYAFIGIEISRYYLAKDAQGNMRQLRWESFDADFPRPATDLSRIQNSREFYSIKGAQFKLPFHSGSDDQIHYIPYSDGAWVALEQIREAIERLKSNLRNLLGDDKGVARLVEFGDRALRLLPAPSEEPIEK